MSLLTKMVVLVLVVTAISIIIGIIMRMFKQKDRLPGFSNFESIDDDSYSDTSEIITVRKYNPDDAETILDDEPESTNKIEPNKEKLIVINILAKGTQQFVGYELLQAILAAGLRFGEMDIFHRHKELSGKGPVLFSLANATEPGSFELQKMGEAVSHGLTLFLRLSGHPTVDMERFELLTQTANQLCEDLDGQLCDENRSVLTKKAMEKHKEQIQAQDMTVKEDNEAVTA